MLAVLKCLAIGIAYVAPFYLKAGHARNYPSIIKFRMACTIGTCSVAWLPMFWTLCSKDQSAHLRLFPLLGIQWQGLPSAVLQPTLLTACLFAGPIAQSMLSRSPSATSGRIQWLQFLRNLVVAPITEEFCFRACMAPLFLLEGWSRTNTVLMTPVMFGVAHAHHLIEMVHFQGVRLQHALLQVLFQFGYTTVFGWYVTHTFLSTGHLAGVIVVHALCNLMGFPPVTEIWSHPYRYQLLLMYAFGIGIFAKQFKPWTLSDSNTGSKFGYGCGYSL